MAHLLSKYVDSFTSQSSGIQKSQTGGQPYSDTYSYQVS